MEVDWMDSRDGDSPGRQEFTSSVDDSMEDKKDESQRSTGEDNETTDICRVCRAPGTSAEPLFHPCKCSGSMRFVHQACLEDWLRVSGRDSLYAPEAPPSLPPSVFLKALAKKAAKRGYKAFRWSVFLTAWLIMAPLGTLWLSQALFQPLNVTFAQIRAVIWLLADYTLVRGPFVVKAALEALFSGSSEPLQRFFFLNSPLPVPGQTVWDSLHPTMYVVFTWLWNTVRTRIFTLTNTDRLKASKVVFEAQLVSASVILVAIAALGLRELILSHTPEDELRVYNERRAAREEREKRHRELVEQTTAAAEVALKMDEETRKEALEALRQAVEASKSLKLDVPQSEGQKSPTEILEEARQRIEQLTKEALKKREELQAAEQEEVIKALSSSSNRDEKEKKKPQVFPAQDACLKSLSMQSADSYDREWLQGIVADHDKLSSGRVASFVPLINVIYILGELKKMALEQKAGTTEGVEAGRVMLALLELDLDDAWFHVACVISSATPEEKLWAQLRLQGHDEPPARFNLDLSFAPPPPEPKPMTRLRTRSRELLLQHEQEEEDDVGTSLEGSEEESDSFSTTDDDESSSVPAPLPSRDDPFAGLVSQMHSSIGSSSRNHQPFHPTSLSRSPSFQYPSPVVPFTAPTSDFTFALDVSNDTSLAASMSTSQNVSPIKPTAAPNIPFTFSMDLKDAAKKKISPFLESSSKGTAASSEKDPKGNMDRREAAKEEISPAMESSSKDIESPENAKKDTKGKKKLEMFPKTLSEVSLKTVRAVGDAPVPEQDLLWYYINVDGNQEGPHTHVRMENFRVLKLLKEETLVRREDWIEFRPVSELLKTKRADWPFIFVDPIGSPPVVASVVRDPNVSRETVERLESILAASNQASQRQQLAMPRLDVANDPVAPIPLAAVNPQEPAPVPPPAIVNEDDDGLQAMININIGPDLQIDIEANDDFNALLDMVGLGGPFLNLFKSLLMYFVISSAIIVITNMIMPLFEIVFGSVSRSLQYITDPIIEPLVDGLLIFGKLVVSFIIGGLEKSVESLAELQISSTLMDVVTNQTIAFLDYLKALSNPVTVTTTFSNASVIAESFGNVTEALQSMDSNVKETVLTALLEAQLTNSYALTILLGYTEMISYLVLSWWWSDLMDHPYVLTVKRLSSSLFKWTLTGLKFTFFIVIELGVFPTYCGFLIDVFTLPTFGPSVTFASRMQFFESYLGVWFFIHWVVGTTFMFQYANYVSMIRGILRPGTMWFLRDPNDPRFQPLQEILTRPFFSQLRKLTFGVFLYSFIIASSVGGFVLGVLGIQSLFGQTSGFLRIYPLRWDYNDALTAFPIDLVIFHLVGPWIFRRIDFNGRMKEANVVWFRLVAKFLRLTSFLFGGRHFEEETDLYTELAGTATDPKNFRFMRVPNHDHIEIKPGVRDIMIPIRQDDPVLGRPNETEEETRSNWVKVFVPTHFRFRITFLILFNQILGLLLAVSILVVPCKLLGCILYCLFKVTEEVSDYRSVLDFSYRAISACLFGTWGYIALYRPSAIFCLTLGAIYIPTRFFWSVSTFGWTRISRRNAVRRPSRTVRHGEADPLISDPAAQRNSVIATWWLAHGRRISSQIFAFFTLVFWAGFLIPLLLGIALETYVLHPLTSPPKSTALFFPLNEWAFGLLLTKMISAFILIGPDNRLRRELNQVVQRGLNLRIWDFHQNLAFPALVIIGLILVLPRSAQRLLERLETKETEESIPYYTQYLMTFTFTLTLIYGLFYRTVDGLAQTIRDEEFRIGRTLHNFEDIQGEVETLAEAD